MPHCGPGQSYTALAAAKQMDIALAVWPSLAWPELLDDGATVDLRGDLEIFDELRSGHCFRTGQTLHRLPGTVSW